MSKTLSTYTYYQKLGLNFDATPSQIKKAYYLLSRTFHPDTKPRAEAEFYKEMFQYLVESYKHLSDDDLKIIYDTKLTAQSKMRICAESVLFEYKRAHDKKLQEQKLEEERDYDKAAADRKDRNHTAEKILQRNARFQRQREAEEGTRKAEEGTHEAEGNTCEAEESTREADARSKGIWCFHNRMCNNPDCGDVHSNPNPPCPKWKKRKDMNCKCEEIMCEFRHPPVCKYHSQQRGCNKGATCLNWHLPSRMKKSQEKEAQAEEPDMLSDCEFGRNCLYRYCLYHQTLPCTKWNRCQEKSCRFRHPPDCRKFYWDSNRREFFCMFERDSTMGGMCKFRHIPK